MAVDSILPVRRAVLADLKSYAPLIALVPAASVYPQSSPAGCDWPFLLYGDPVGAPITGTCLDGNEIASAIHAFAKPRVSGGQVVETAEDYCARIIAAVGKRLGKRKLTLAGGHVARVRWTSSTLTRDGAEADAYHGIVRFRVRVMS